MRTSHSLGAHVAETTFYTPFANLLNTVGERLKPRVHFQAHPGTHGAGLADGGLFPLAVRSQTTPLPGQFPERGAVEIKPPGTSLATLAQSAQVRRYLQTYGLCLISNYHQFQLLELRNGQPNILETYDLTVTADDLWHLPLKPLVAEHAETLPDFLLRVMTRKVPLEKPKDVAWLLASYAREARARAEHHDLPAFRNVKAALEESLGIEFEGEKGEHFFRSTLVQTLFYGIFSAWVLWRHSPEYKVPHPHFNWRLSDDYLKVPILRKLFREVSDRTHLNTIQLTEILEWAGEALNRVQGQLFDIFQGEQAVAYFYEPFLEAFDPQLRKELGVWYTPRQIVHYQVERVDHLLRTELGQPLGLASPAVRILDPCCGTGAYLVAVLERIHRTLLAEAGDDTALVPAALRHAALTRVFGFEIMPAPFVIAHMEIARLLDDARAPLAGTERAGIFLTNALTGWIPEVHPQSVLSEEFRREREDSEQIKQQGTILVILGNPPYNGYAGIARIEEERGLTTAYRAPVAGLPAPQGQGLNDLYIRFFRIAERRIAGNRDGQGIVSFISNYSWLDGLSHTTMRHHYLQTFNDIYIDNLHGDRKISEYAPDGRTSETVFAVTGSSVGIRIGTAISTLVRSSLTEGEAKLHYRDFDAARSSERRESMLESLKETNSGYTPVLPHRRLGSPFKTRVVGVAYLGWPKLAELFPVYSPGLTTSTDALIIDMDFEILERRMRLYFSDAVSHSDLAQLVPAAVTKRTKFNHEQVRRRLQEKAFRPWQIRSYLYRPFDLRWIYWEPSEGLIDRERSPLMLEVRGTNLLLEARQSEVGDTFCRGTVSRSLPDHFGNGPSSFFPSTVLSSPGRIFSDVTEQVNLSDPAILAMSSTGGDGRDLFFHALGIMHTPHYRTENAGALLSDWPRIPLPATADLLSHSAALGRQLADLLDAESAVSLKREWSFLAALQRPSGDLKPEHLALTAGWGSRGQGSTVMPGRGKVTLRPWTPVERTRLAALAATQSLSLEAAVACSVRPASTFISTAEAFGAPSPPTSGATPSAATRSSRSGSATASSLSSVAPSASTSPTTSPRSSAASPPSFSSAPPSTPATRPSSPPPPAY